jgi:2-C-methyl-D-erythritol 2,4-cyclodiphosphate synthase
LGGIDIEAPVEALGHSDADVLLHAIVDSLLGAGRLGDIGRLFPDTAAENRDRDSADFLREAMRLVRSGGWQVVNLDSVILLQSPKLAPHLEAMSQRIAAIAELRPDQIGIKAKTGERVGPVGRREAIAARVVCLLWKAD